MSSEPNVSSPRVFYSSRVRTVGLLFLSALFAVAGGFMFAADAPWAWAVLAFGLVGTAVFLVMLVRPNRLELSAQGFSTVTLGRRWSVDWSQCGEFRPWKDNVHIAAQSIVVFDCTAPSIGGRALELGAVALTGANAALPETYGMSAVELASILNDYREANTKRS